VRAIVTGGAGFIGSHVAEALLARGDDVHIVDNLATGSRTNVPDGASFHERDIRESLDELFDDVEPNACFHLAAQADVGTSVERPDYDAEVNVLGTLRVLEGSRRNGTQVLFSSTGGAMYGEVERPAREGDERRPLAPYGASKLAGEEYLATWNRLHGTRHVSLRFANVYGPRQLAQLEGGVIAIFLERMAADEPTQIFGDGRQSRDFIYVTDVAQAMLAAAGHAGGVFNVGTGVATTVLELHDACRRVAGSAREPEFAPPRLGDLTRSVLDPASAERELGWRAQYDLDAGLSATWEWVSGT
jgi:UDP-glucose 4-epimerase